MPLESQIEISIVSPVYRAETLVTHLVARLRKTLDALSLNYEIILVEDGSPDQSWDAIVKECRECSRVAGLRLSRNFGQHYAISAGLNRAKGRWIVVMDCDLQDQPEEIPRLISRASSGYDIVRARRSMRQDGLIKKGSSKLFHFFLGYLTGTRLDASIANFGIYHCKVVTAINGMSETIRYFPAMVQWVGFRSSTIDVEHAARPDGKSSYNWSKLINLACDIALAYSDKPLKLVVKMGLMISGAGFCFASYTIVQALRGKITVLGYSGLLVSVWILAGLIILITGVVGLYVGKIFEGVKRRPSFIVSEIIP